MNHNISLEYSSRVYIDKTQSYADISCEARVVLLKLLSGRDVIMIPCNSSSNLQEGERSKGTHNNTM